MQKHVLYFLAALIAGSLLANSALAKVWLLPDYQAEQFYSKRQNGEDDKRPKNPDISTSCSDYGGIAASSLAEGHVCEGGFNIKGLSCCRSSSCSPEYKYTGTSCPTSDFKNLTGSSCEDKNGIHYKGCECDSSIFTVTAADCGDLGVIEGSRTCSVDGVTYYEGCKDDPCADESNVIWCLDDRCSHSCGSNQCLADSCDISCDAGSRWVEGSGCMAVACPTNYATKASSCRTYALSVRNSTWVLDPLDTNGFVDDLQCQKCEQVCNDGYADYDDYWCGQVPATIDCEALGYKKDPSIDNPLAMDCMLAGLTRLYCPFDENYYICVGEEISTSIVVPNPDPEPAVSCSDFNANGTEYTLNCPNLTGSVCLTSSYQESVGGDYCKFSTLCATDSDCNKYLSVALPADINSEADINDFGAQYCQQKYGAKDLLLWADPKCSDPATLCIRCDVSQLCDSSYNLDDCPDGANCSSCGGKYKVEGCYGCYIQSGSSCTYHKGITEQQMCNEIAVGYAGGFDCNAKFQSEADIDQCGTVLAKLLDEWQNYPEEDDPNVICDIMCPTYGDCPGNPCP